MSKEFRFPSVKKKITHRKKNRGDVNGIQFPTKKGTYRRKADRKDEMLGEKKKTYLLLSKGTDRDENLRARLGHLESC
jgi:hypothetical protein